MTSSDRIGVAVAPVTRGERPGTTGLRVSEDELRELLIARLKLITAEDFDTARALAARLHMPLEYVIVQRGRVPLKLLLQKLAAHWRVQFVDLKATDVKPEALRRVREDYARLHVLIPFDLKADDLSVAMADPRGSQVLVELAHVTGLRIVPYLAPPDSIRRAQLLYRGNLL